MSIRLRLTLVYGLLLVLTLVGFDLLLYWTLFGNLSREFDDDLRVRAAEVTRSIRPGKDGRLDVGDVKSAALEPATLENSAEPGVYVQVLDAGARAIANSGTLLPVDQRLSALALSGQEAVGSIPVGQDESIRSLVAPVRVGSVVVGAVQVSQSTRFLEATLAEVRTLLLLGSVAALVAATLAGWLLLGRALRNVERVTASARRIVATGRLEGQLDQPGRPDEIGQLVRAFNLMVSRLERSFEQQRSLLADTSHELRNPLTALSGNLDILQQDLDPEERDEVIVESKQQAAHMGRLVSDLLLLARADTGLEIERQSVQLDELVRRLHQRACLDQRHAVLLDGCDEVVVVGDAQRLQQLGWNLVENALRYTPQPSEIRLALRRAGAWAELSVRDNGPGIGAEHLDRIFERFYRVDKARSRTTGGSGLGLAIARHLAEAHGGTIAVESAPGRGSLFTVRLPCEVAVASAPEARELVAIVG